MSSYELIWRLIVLLLLSNDNNQDLDADKEQSLKQVVACFFYIIGK